MPATYTAPEKRIFSYHNGQMVVHEDPQALRRRLVQAAAGNLSQLCRDAHEPTARTASTAEEDPIAQLRQCDAQDKLAAVVRQAFKLPPWEPLTNKGTLDADCWRILGEYWEWLEKNAKKAGS